MLAVTRPIGGPNPTAAQVLLIVFLGAIAADRIVGGPSAWRSTASDRGSFWLIQAGQLAAVAGTLAAARWVHAADLPASIWPLGAVVIAAGGGLRIWSLRALGAEFHRDVRVDESQRLVTTGPYRWLRHPSYTAALLLFAGLGVGQANVVSFAVSIVLPAAVYLYRIRVEEAELEATLGDRYREFAAQRHRLIPGVY